MVTLTKAGNLTGTYTYNAREQLVSRVLTNMTPSGTTHFVHDLMGNVIAETNGVATGTVREYIWLPETEIAPVMAARAQVDRPLAVVDGVNTASPVTWWVHTDHLNRPVMMTDAAKGQVWQAVWKPFGEAQSITGPAALDTRFPGQWFQIESGLHYNWHRQYDPTTGRYTQPDPLGFVDGPGVFAYAKSASLSYIDKDGRGIGPYPLPPGDLYDWLFPNQCYPHDDDDDPYQRCLDAADGSQSDWIAFCQGSALIIPFDTTRVPRCMSHQFSTPTEKKNWCYNEFQD
jgi:RHS repeat-associated protein